MSEQVRYITLSEAATRVGLTRATMREWVRRGRIASYKPGKRVLVRESDLAALVEGSRVQKDGAQ